MKSSRLFKITGLIQLTRHISGACVYSYNPKKTRVKRSSHGKMHSVRPMLDRLAHYRVVTYSVKGNTLYLCSESLEALFQEVVKLPSRNYFNKEQPPEWYAWDATRRRYIQIAESVTDWLQGRVPQRYGTIEGLLESDGMTFVSTNAPYDAPFVDRLEYAFHSSYNKRHYAEKYVTVTGAHIGNGCIRAELISTDMP